VAVLLTVMAVWGRSILGVHALRGPPRTSWFGSAGAVWEVLLLVRPGGFSESSRDRGEAEHDQDPIGSSDEAKSPIGSIPRLPLLKFACKTIAQIRSHASERPSLM